MAALVLLLGGEYHFENVLCTCSLVTLLPLITFQKGSLFPQMGDIRVDI